MAMLNNQMVQQFCCQKWKMCLYRHSKIGHAYPHSKSTRWQLVTMALALFSLSVCCIGGVKASQLLIPDFHLGLLGLIFGGFELRNDME